MRDWAGSLKQTIAEVRRRRVFRVAAAYLVVSWLLIQVGGTTFEPLGLPPWSIKLLIVLLALGFVPACVLSWIFDIGPRGVERTMPATLATTGPAAAPAIAPAATTAPDKSVAILPFTDLSESKDQGYFCDGLAEEILNALTSVRGMRVASRTSSFRFRDGATDAREIGRLLNVAAIMEGSVRKLGAQVRVTAQLIDAETGYQLWSKSFHRQLADIFAIQEEIARSVAVALRISLRVAEAIDLQRYAPRDLRAYDFYLRGRQLEGGKDRVKFDHAAQMYRRAIEIDPDYAQAHAGLADALIELLSWRMSQSPAVLEEAKAASQKAMALAPELAETHVAYAHTLTIAGQHDAAKAEFEQALQLNPDLYEASYYYARYCFTRGEFAKAVELFEASHRANPDEFQALVLAVNAAERIPDMARAIDLIRRALAAIAHQLEIDPDNSRAHYFAATLHAQMGNKEAGRQSAETALRLRPDAFDTLYNVACYYARAGETERALELLDRAVNTGEGFRDWFDHDADLDTLRPLPRYREIVARLA